MAQGQCVFCKIAGGGAEAQVVFRSDSCLAFLDTKPVFAGHCLIVPRDHFETLADLPPALIQPLFCVTRLLSKAVPLALGARGSFVGINNRVSQSVPHLHVHVIPRRPKDGLRGFFWPRISYVDEEEATATAEAIKEAIRSIERPGDQR